jgi:hypothetical protein
MHRRWCPVTVITVILLALSSSGATWFCTSARWRSRTAAHEASCRRVQAELLAEMGSLQDEAARARIRAAQVTRDTTGWAEGYKHGCSDMIRAMAALHGGVVMSQNAAEAPGAE